MKKKRKEPRKRLKLHSTQNGLKPKKSEYKQKMLIGGFLYLLSILVTLHLCARLNFDKRASFFDSLSNAFEDIASHPFQFVAMPTNALTYIGMLTVVFVLVAAYMYADYKKNGELLNTIAYGSAHFNDDMDSYNIKYSSPSGSVSKDGNNNMILTNDVYLSMNTRDTRRNNNVLVIGGSGAGKSRYVVKPNLCQMPINCNFICTDPSGELLADTGEMLEGCGYNIKVFNLVNMEKSNTYNPLKYINEENDVILLVDCILANTTDPAKKGGDDFWEKAQKLMLQAFIFLLWLHGDEFHLPQTFESVMSLMRNCTISEKSRSDSTELSVTDKYFAMVEFGYTLDENGEFIPGTSDSPRGNRHGEDIAVKQYKNFKMGAGKTLQSILISCMARLSSFDSQKLIDLTSSDTMDLGKLGDEKTAVFIIIPQEHDSFNFLAAMMYSQMFQMLYYHAENECQGNYLVKDKNGEMVKVFPINHNVKEEETKEEENEEEVRITLSDIKKKETFLLKMRKRWKNSKTQKEKKKQEKLEKLEEEKLKNAVEGQEAPTYTEAETRPNDDPGEYDDEKVRKLAEDYVEKLKNIQLYKKGKKYIIKVQEGDKEEVIGEYTNEKYARSRAIALKNSSVSRCGLFLPYHVRFMLDEFANIGQIPNFTKKLATMRKYEISATVILQNLAQIKNMYKDDWGSIVGNCDSFLFLGCPEFDTLEYVSKKLGKKTIKVRNNSASYGSKSGTSASYQLVGRELMLPDELSQMSDTECILIIRGVPPFRGDKFKYENHFNYKLTADGDGGIYKIKISDSHLMDVNRLSGSLADSFSKSKSASKSIENKRYSPNRKSLPRSNSFINMMASSTKPEIHFKMEEPRMADEKDVVEVLNNQLMDKSDFLSVFAETQIDEDTKPNSNNDSNTSPAEQTYSESSATDSEIPNSSTGNSSSTTTSSVFTF